MPTLIRLLIYVGGRDTTVSQVQATHLPHFAVVVDSAAFTAGVVLERGLVSEAKREVGSAQQGRDEQGVR